MAGASMKDIKLRIKSVQSTMQITKAMELVASSKLRRAKERQERCRPYFTGLHQTLRDIEAATSDFSSPYQTHREVKKRCLIVIAGDRGLAGGYNSNIFRVVTEELAKGTPVCVLPIGKRAVDFCVRKSIEILTIEFAEAATVSVADCFTISNLVTKGYLSGQFDEVSIVFTQFVSMLTQTPRTDSLLPLEPAQEKPESGVRPLVIVEGKFEGTMPPSGCVRRHRAQLHGGHDLRRHVRIRRQRAGRAPHGHGCREQERRGDDRRSEPALQPGPPGRDHAGDHGNRRGRRALTTTQKEQRYG